MYTSKYLLKVIQIYTAATPPLTFQTSKHSQLVTTIALFLAVHALFVGQNSVEHAVYIWIFIYKIFIDKTYTEAGF